MTTPASNTSTSSATSAVLGASWVIAATVHGDATSAAAAPQQLCRDYGVHIEAGRIVKLAPYEALVAEVRQRDPDLHAEFLPDHILMPGLVNCHGHAAMSLLRGYADDYPLNQWLHEYIWPVEATLVNAQFVHDGASLAMAEMLLSGTTTFSDMYFFPDTTAAAAEAAGMRAQINFPIIDFPSSWASSSEEYFAKGLELFDTYRNSRLIQVGFAPHAPYTVDDASFARVAVLAEEVDTHIQLHLHETASEIANSMREHGASPAARLHRLGVLGPRTQAVHFSHFSEADIELLAQTNTSVVHCSASNAKLASGYSAIQQLLAAGVRVGLGTDSAASSNSLDLFDSMRLAALLAKQHGGDATALAANQALQLATQGGADALGLGSKIGSLSPGKYADMIAIDTRRASLQPLHNPISQLVYTQAGGAVNHVWIGGRRVVKARQLVNLDLDGILERAGAWRATMADTGPLAR